MGWDLVGTFHNLRQNGLGWRERGGCLEDKVSGEISLLCVALFFLGQGGEPDVRKKSLLEMVFLFFLGINIATASRVLRGFVFASIDVYITLLIRFIIAKHPTGSSFLF